MTTIFVTRHAGARDWLARRGHAVDRITDELTDADLATLGPGDIVIGTLPVALAAAVCARGAQYLNLVIPAVPRELRGQELDADMLTRLGARIEAFEVWPGEGVTIAASEVHVGIVSAEPLGNLIPALIDRPTRFVALASDTARRSGQHERLRAALESEGIACEVLPLPEDGPGLRTRATELAAAFSEGGAALNATGGTKPMSLALTDAFRRRGRPVFYCDTGRRVRLDLNSGTETPLAPVLTMRTALLAQGAVVRSIESESADWLGYAHRRAELAQWLVSYFPALEALFDELDTMGKAALDARGENLRDAEQPFPSGSTFTGPQAAKRREALGRMAVAGLIEQRADNTRLKFRSAEAARWLRGRWFECWAWKVAQAARPQQCFAGVQVNWQGTATRQLGANEFDLVLLHANRMLVGECKTGKFGRDTAEHEQDVLNTLESLGRHAAGVLGLRIVLSARRLGEAAHDRAQRYGIVLLDGERVREFGERVEKWVSGH